MKILNIQKQKIIHFDRSPPEKLIIVIIFVPPLAPKKKRSIVIIVVPPLAQKNKERSIVAMVVLLPWGAIEVAKEASENRPSRIAAGEP